MISASVPSASFNPAKWRFGMTSTCVGAFGLMSSKAKTSSSSYTFFEGISPRMIRQKRQFGSLVMIVPGRKQKQRRRAFASRGIMHTEQSDSIQAYQENRAFGSGSLGG